MAPRLQRKVPEISRDEHGFSPKEDNLQISAPIAIHEEYKVPARPETLKKLREFLDESLKLNSSPSIYSETSG